MKEKIEKDKGWTVDSQKLIYAGKILTDEQNVGDLKIDDKKFVVVMVAAVNFIIQYEILLL